MIDREAEFDTWFESVGAKVRNDSDNLKAMMKAAFMGGYEARPVYTAFPCTPMPENKLFECWLKAYENAEGKDFVPVEHLDELCKEMQNRVSNAWHVLWWLTMKSGEGQGIFFKYPVKSPMLEVYDHIAEICKWLKQVDAEKRKKAAGAKEQA